MSRYRGDTERLTDLSNETQKQGKHCVIGLGLALMDVLGKPEMPGHHTHGFHSAGTAPGKEKEGNQHEPNLTRSQTLGYIPNLLSPRLSFRCEIGYSFLLKRYWITDIIMIVLGQKKLRGRGGTSRGVPISTETFQCPSGSLLIVFHFCPLHH